MGTACYNSSDEARPVLRRQVTTPLVITGRRGEPQTARIPRRCPGHRRGERNGHTAERVRTEPPGAPARPDPRQPGGRPAPPAPVLPLRLHGRSPRQAAVRPDVELVDLI